MGYIRHHAIIVTSWKDDQLTEAHLKARAIFEPQQVTSIVASVVNKYESFMVGTDGSKEGWSDSDEGDKRREQFTRWLDSQLYEDGSSSLSWVEVQYGDDNGVTRIVRDSDERERVGS
jgi:hypothetical protein